MKIICTILIGIALIVGLGIVYTSYLSYKAERIPVYQTEISDYEFQTCGAKDEKFAAHVKSELNKLAEAHRVKTLKCFIFHQNINRVIYRIILVGNIRDTADLSEYNTWENTVNDISLSSALERCGFSPQKDEKYTLVSGLLPNNGVIYITKNHFIIDQIVTCKKFLQNDEQKKALLKKIIRPRREKQK